MRAAAALPRRRPSRPAAGVVLAAAVLAGTTGCTGSVLQVPAAEQATDPGCAQVSVLLREVGELAGLPGVPTSGQSTAGWASPDGATSVVVRCGVPVPPPTTDACLTVDGVDWVASDEQGAPPWTTYGRAPATEVVVTGDVVAADVLPVVGATVAALEPRRACV